ncbi:hypothetical protein [Streptomyces bacillaris]|uniref:hypothetical protein n=1 Tax=Streptomyces bacillaris TaxID=68179 RepID=UPI0036601778
MPTTPTPADRPADQLRAAAERARETGDPLHLVAAGLLEVTAQSAPAASVDETARAALAVARQLLGTTEGAGAATTLEPQDHPGADLFVALRAVGLDVDEAHRRIHAYAGMVLRQEKAIAAPPAPADRAAVLREAAEAVDNTEFPNEYVDLFDNGARWASRLLRRLADDAAAGVQPPTEGEEPEPLTEAQIIRQHVTTVHLIGDQLADVESWLWQRLADARDTTVSEGREPTDRDVVEAHELALRFAMADQPADGTQCTCGGRFPTFHLHADTHEPAAPAAPEEQR